MGIADGEHDCQRPAKAPRDPRHGPHAARVALDRHPEQTGNPVATFLGDKASFGQLRSLEDLAARPAIDSARLKATICTRTRSGS